MSLTRLAVRLSAVRALRGMTLAGSRVTDSSITPLDAAIKEQPEPFIMVTTDSHDRAITGLDLMHGEDGLDLVIEVAIAAKVTVEVQEGGTALEITTPTTDAGFELTLDLIEAQIARALTAGRTEWSQIFCGLVPRITRRLSRRGASAEDGVRFAARQIVLTCDPLADPVPGEQVPEGGPWARFLAAIAADADTAPLAPLLRLHIEGDEAPTWDRMAEMLGISAASLDAIGLAPAILSTDGEEVQLDTVVADQEGGGEFVLTEAAADDQVPE